MTPKELKHHKEHTKVLSDIPEFKPLKRGKLPKPLHRMGGPRLSATKIIELSDTHVAVFLWRDGQILTDTAFFGHLFCRIPNGTLYPLLEFHWHPSHKGFHAKTPCETEIDYTNRMLPGAPELALATQEHLDPRVESDRVALINEFCRVCGITISSPHDNKTISLWN